MFELRPEISPARSPNQITSSTPAASPCPLSRNSGLVRTFAATVAALAISLGLAVTGAADAFATDQHQVLKAVSLHSGHSGTQQHGQWHRVVGPRTRPIGYAGWAYPGAHWSMPASPTPYFVPGRGIFGESCDLPTSTCSDRVRVGG